MMQESGIGLEVVGRSVPMNLGWFIIHIEPRPFWNFSLKRDTGQLVVQYLHGVMGNETTDSLTTHVLVVHHPAQAELRLTRPVRDRWGIEDPHMLTYY